MKWIDAEPDRRIISPFRASCHTKIRKTLHGGAVRLCSQRLSATVKTIGQIIPTV
jgi:hypothetical protein